MSEFESKRAFCSWRGTCACELDLSHMKLYEAGL
uniref:Uncharacterized protein n=1 Tax=Anguilla anguilla TaxID=7936 RepID=A0A0E9UT92_ANGAN